MTNKEKSIILNQYKEMYKVNHILKIDKSDTLRELKFLIITLDLKRELYEVQNEVIAEKKGYNCIIKEMYQMIFESFLKYGKYVNYDIEEIELYFDDLQYEMSEEEIQYYNKRIKYIKEA